MKMPKLGEDVHTFRGVTSEGVPVVGCKTKDDELRLSVDRRLDFLKTGDPSASRTGWVLWTIDRHASSTVVESTALAVEALISDKPVAELPDVGVLTPELVGAFMGSKSVGEVFSAV